MAELLNKKKREQLQKNPLNKHCRKMLKKVNSEIEPESAVGIPELLIWGLDRSKEMQNFPEKQRETLEQTLWNMVNQGPEFVTRWWNSEMEDEEWAEHVPEILKEQNPEEVVYLLMDRLHEVLMLHSETYNPNVPPMP